MIYTEFSVHVFPPISSKDKIKKSFIYRLGSKFWIICHSFLIETWGKYVPKQNVSDIIIIGISIATEQLILKLIVFLQCCGSRIGLQNLDLGVQDFFQVNYHEGVTVFRNAFIQGSTEWTPKLIYWAVDTVQKDGRSQLYPSAPCQVVFSRNSKQANKVRETEKNESCIFW